MWNRFAVALVVALSLVERASAQPADSVTLVKADALLDPRTGHVLSPAAVLVRGHRISEVGPPSRMEADAPPGAKVIDLGAATLLPGLIDSHTHLLIDVVQPAEAEIARRYNGRFLPGLLLAITDPPARRVFLGARMAREDLQSGFTTVRNLGHSGIDGDVVLRDAIRNGVIPGPRILAAARKLTAPGGYFQSLNPALANAIVEQEFLEIGSVAGARQAVREDVFHDVDIIKVAIEDDVTQAELDAVVDEAHRQHRRVAVHATTPTSIQMAIDAHADSIEHGNGVTTEQLKLMRQRGIFIDLTPTWYGGQETKILESTIAVSAAFRAEMEGSDARSKRRYDDLVERVLRSGVKFAAGSDMCWFYPGKTRGEASAQMFSSLRQAGMKPLDILRAVTSNAAEMLGWQDRVGAIEAGKFADLVAVAGDPLMDITELERVQFVMKDGEVIRNDRAFQGALISRSNGGWSQR